MFNVHKSIIFINKEPIYDAFATIDETFEDFDELMVTIRKKCEVEKQIIEDYQDRLFALVKSDQLDKEKAFDLINNLLKLCRDLNECERNTCQHFYREAGTCYAVLRPLMEML